MNKQKRPAILRGVVGLALVLCSVARAVGQQFHADPFDGRQVVWGTKFVPAAQHSRTQIVQHRREKGDWNRTGNVEVIRLQTSDQNQQMYLEYRLPPARPFDELKLTLRVKSNQEGLRLCARVVFVDHADPRTGLPLTALVRGDIYRSGNEWQNLTCAIDQRAVKSALVELRGLTSLPISSPGQTYVDQAVLSCDLNPGGAEIVIDDLKFGPIIAPSRFGNFATSDHGHETPSVTRSNHQSRVEMRLGQLRVDGRPFLPRVAPWHDGDSVDVLKNAGINTVLIPDITDSDLLREIGEAGMYAIAVPPRPKGDASGPSQAESASSLLSTDSRILFWYLGTRITPGSQKKLIDWSRWLRTTDPLQRPLMADVTGAERTYSRHLDLLGLSGPVLGTSVSLREYRTTLLHRRAMSQPGKFMWTWVQADTPSAHENRIGTPYVLEPEQIRLQMYAAIASGSKAIGFWKKTPLTSSRQGDEERRLMMHQLNLELGLIEDWLATAQLAGSVTCEAGATLKGRAGGTAAKQAMLAAMKRKSGGRANSGPQKTNVEAAIFNTEKGKLILPVWYSDSGQFVPSELVAENLSFVVHVPEAERAVWLVTTTGIRSLGYSRPGGGLRIDLSTADRQTFLDQTAIVVITSRNDVLAELNSRISAIAEDSARTSIKLARAKLSRVQHVESRIAATDGRTQPILRHVDQLLNAAAASAESTDYHSARRQAQQAMRYLRRLQHLRWKSATRSLSSPLSSPHVVSYQTLPDHQALINHIRTAQPIRATRLLPGVTGNDESALRNTGWSRFAGTSALVRKEARFLKGRERYSLALTAAPADSKDIPGTIAEPPIRVTSPVLQINRGEIAYVTGRVRVPVSVTGSERGAMLFDNIGGPSASLRWKRRTNGWVQFEMLREAKADGPFYLSLLLSGLGRMEIADLEVVVYPTAGGATLVGHSGGHSVGDAASR